MHVRFLATGLAALALACATTPAERIAAWREPAVSRRTFERVLPFLEDLSPGDDLRDFAAAREVHWLPLVVDGRRTRRPVVIMPSWITSLSGGAPGGLSLFGQLVARSQDVIHGSHVFGYVVGDRIVPRYQVLTTATLVGPDEYETLVADRARDIGTLSRPGGVLYFRDLHVAGARPLGFSDPASASGEGPPGGALPAGGIASFYSEASFQAVAPVVEKLPPGTDLFGLLRALGTRFVTKDFGETHSLLAPGFLNTRRVRTQTLEGPDGIIKLRPFGWLEADREVVRLVAIFDNDRLVRVVPRAGAGDWTAGLDP